MEGEATLEVILSASEHSGVGDKAGYSLIWSKKRIQPHRPNRNRGVYGVAPIS